MLPNPNKIWRPNSSWWCKSHVTGKSNLTEFEGDRLRRRGKLWARRKRWRFSTRVISFSLSFELLPFWLCILCVILCALFCLCSFLVLSCCRCWYRAKGSCYVCACWGEVVVNSKSLFGVWIGFGVWLVRGIGWSACVSHYISRLRPEVKQLR